MEINIPFPYATGNHYKSFNFKTKRVYVTKQAQAYRMAVKCEVLKKSERFDGYVDVDMVIFPPDKRKRDIDNICKVVWDALTLAGLWKDDRMIRNLHVSVKEPAKPGFIRMEVTNAVLLSGCTC